MKTIQMTIEYLLNAQSDIQWIVDVILNWWLILFLAPIQSPQLTFTFSPILKGTYIISYKYE